MQKLLCSKPRNLNNTPKNDHLTIPSGERITTLLTLVAMTGWTKDNFKMTGRIDGTGNDTVTIGGQVPELGLKDLQGNVLDLKSLRGKYVVLDFWGSWCT